MSQVECQLLLMAHMKGITQVFLKVKSFNRLWSILQNLGFLLSHSILLYLGSRTNLNRHLDIYAFIEERCQNKDPVVQWKAISEKLWLKALKKDLLPLFSLFKKKQPTNQTPPPPPKTNNQAKKKKKNLMPFCLPVHYITQWIEEEKKKEKKHYKAMRKFYCQV